MRLKKYTSLLLILMLMFSFAACTKEEPQAEAPAPAPAEQPEAPQLEDKVVIYSTHSEDLLELVATEFTKETGVAVDYINLKGELAERVAAEKSNPQADVMFGGASNLFMDLKAQDAFEPYQATWDASIDPLFKDAEHYWYGTIQTPVILFYNTELVNPEDLPGDWADLADPKYAGQLVFRNALSSSARVMYSALLQQFEQNATLDEGWAFMTAMDQNTKQYFDSGSLMMQAIGRKEASISFSVLNDIMDNKINNNLPIEIVDLESGSPVITDGIAVIKNAPHPEAAKAFVEFAGSAKVQSLLANAFNRMPTQPEALEGAPAWMSEVTFKVMDVDWVDLSAKQSEWMQKWDTEIKSSDKDVKK
ncbi:extracellular solute-binding protein [Acidaminobacter hydrogenoformans]|uniref:Iron(III) transport system substrate-binding protein n=1 Tax=Acidaminobacter hydrogenoformans DSM 2784 TaxID=1120920 RepID=A0A1G5RQU3_9FIRM|nr:extracellular solute-binding protein [Acidaminobacter hydrogenoformans]SCZ76455.1 iron(III) transport system substrate-binding protein [Acidaminobacter hydrogenoformans DSM 2784]